MIASVAVEHQAIWATAFYAGLRLGELRALKVEDVDLKKMLIHVHAGWDVKEGLIAPKSKSGVRKLPILDELKPLLERQAELRPTGCEFFFGIAKGTPFNAWKVRRQSYEAWETAGLAKIVFHEARHTYASILIAAGLDAKKIQTYMGHSSISTTFNIYGHLFPGNEAESAEVINAFLAADTTDAPTPIPTPA